MINQIKNYKADTLRDLCFAAFAMVFIFYCSSFSYVSLPSTNILGIDKLVHFCVFGMLATCVYRLSFIKERGLWGALAALLFTAAFGASDEIHQYFTGRTPDIMDWLADSAGAVSAITLYAALKPYRLFLEYELKLGPSRSKES